MFLVARAPFLFGPALAFGLVIAAASGVDLSDKMFSTSSEVTTSTMAFLYFSRKVQRRALAIRFLRSRTSTLVVPVN